jgi:hypothetical protein
MDMRTQRIPDEVQQKVEVQIESLALKPLDQVLNEFCDWIDVTWGWRIEEGPWAFVFFNEDWRETQMSSGEFPVITPITHWPLKLRRSRADAKPLEQVTAAIIELIGLSCENKETTTSGDEGEIHLYYPHDSIEIVSRIRKAFASS